MTRGFDHLTMMTAPVSSRLRNDVGNRVEKMHSPLYHQQCHSVWEFAKNLQPSVPTQSIATTPTSVAEATACRNHRYTHNPYASAGAWGGNISVDAVCNTGDGGHKPTSVPCSESGVDAVSLSSGLIGRFRGAAGELSRTACTSAGRNMLVSVLRLHHVEMTRAIVDELRPHLHVVALDPNGCHVVRALVEFIPTTLMVTLVPHFTPSIVRALAIGSPYTRRVLQSIFERHKCEALTPIVESIARDSQQLAQRQQGCITIIRTIENTLPHQQRSLIVQLLPALPALTMNCYGNYVVQCVLRHMDRGAITAVVCQAFAGHWVALSCNKFASNVVEKVVRLLDGHARSALIAETVCDPANLRRLMNDCFGNFVLQAIIDSSRSKADFRMIAQCVRPLLQTCSHGRRIESKLQCVMARAGVPAIGE
uniref:WGS project CAEQ00000000 data, annotated contig 1319 n=1 Tax=Trypanosoma congolense (strain IL3000) TaxID=1068625 RepID=F9W5E6_TRYCI|nr:unnamed protein product [Trypanosoma congolense IL3000]